MTDPPSTKIVACVRCGQPFPFRYDAGRTGYDPTTRAIDALCDTCFDRWVWQHPPQPEAMPDGA